MARPAAGAAIHASFADAFRDGARFVHPRDGELTMARHALGELSVRSGRLAACDPFVADWAARDDGFVRRVATGPFPVELALAVGEPARVGTRVAAARVVLAERPAVRWEPALCDQGSAARSAIASLDGYGVDAGAGCFYDPATSAVVDEATSEAWIAALHAEPARGWGAHLAPLGDGNVAMFTSGDGDGWYRSYWGLDEAGFTVELVTDFALLLGNVEVRVPLPAARGQVVHPELASRGLTVRRGWWRSAVIERAHAEAPRAGIVRSDGGPLAITVTSSGQRYRWPRLPAGVALEIAIVVGRRALVAIA